MEEDMFKESGFIKLSLDYDNKQITIKTNTKNKSL